MADRKTVIEQRRPLLDDYFKVEEAVVRFEKRDGTMSEPVRRLDLVREDAVCAVLVNKARGTVILVRQFRYGALSRGQAYMTEIVAGLIDHGEPAEEAITREILEEAGYGVGKLERIACYYPSPGITSERGILFYAETSGPDPVAAGGGLAEESEDIEVMDVPLPDAFAMLDSGEIVDAKTLIGLMWLRARS